MQRFRPSFRVLTPVNVAFLSAFLFCASSALLNIDAAAQWKHCIGPGYWGASCVASIGNDVYVGNSSGVSRTPDHGVTWGMVNPDMSSLWVRSLAVQENTLFVLVGENMSSDPALFQYYNNEIYGHAGLYRMSQSGVWKDISGLLPRDSFMSISVVDSFLFCYVEGVGLYQSTDQGDHWSLTPPLYRYWHTFSESGPIELAAGSQPWVSTNGGVNWYQLEEPSSDHAISCLVLDSTLYVDIYNNSVHINMMTSSVQNAMREIDSFRGINAWHESTDLNNKWVDQMTSLGHTAFALIKNSDQTSDQYISASSDRGSSWRWSSNGMSYKSLESVGVCNGDLYATGTMFPGIGMAVFRSTDTGKSWTPSSRSLRAITSLAIGSIGNWIITCTKEGFLRSSNDGATWEAVGTGIRGTLANTFFASEANLFAGTDSGAFVSMDSGATWQESDQGITARAINSFAQIGGTLFAAGIWKSGGGNVFASTDNGGTWSATTKNNLPTVTTLATHNDTLFAAGFGWGPVYSLDMGKTWSKGQSIGNVTSIQQTSNGMFAATASTKTWGGAGSVWRSTDGCKTWTELRGNIAWNNVLSLAANDNLFIAATHDSGTFVSTNSGNSWRAINGGYDLAFEDSYGYGFTTYALMIKDGYVFAAKEDGVWRASLAEISGAANGVAPKEKSETVSIYPNPAIGWVTVSGLPDDLQRIEVVNIIGQTVVTLHASGRSDSDIKLDLSSLPSGTYMVVVRTNSDVRTLPFVKQ